MEEVKDVKEVKDQNPWCLRLVGQSERVEILCGGLVLNFLNFLQFFHFFLLLRPAELRCYQPAPVAPMMAINAPNPPAT